MGVDDITIIDHEIIESTSTTVTVSTNIERLEEKDNGEEEKDLMKFIQVKKVLK